jgi:hypothetical protein
MKAGQAEIGSVCDYKWISKFSTFREWTVTKNFGVKKWNLMAKQQWIRYSGSHVYLIVGHLVQWLSCLLYVPKVPGRGHKLMCMPSREPAGSVIWRINQLLVVLYVQNNWKLIYWQIIFYCCRVITYNMAPFCLGLFIAYWSFNASVASFGSIFSRKQHSYKCSNNEQL